MTLRNRLLAYFVIVALLPLIAIAYVSFNVANTILREKSTQFIAGTVNQVGREIDGLLQGSVEVAEMVASEPIVQDALRFPLQDDVARRYAQELRIDSRLNFIQSYMTEEIFGIYVIGLNGGQYKSNYTTYELGDYSDLDWYQEILTSKRPVWRSTEDGALAVDTLPRPHVTVGIPVVDKASGQTTGVVLVDFQRSLLEDKVTGAKIGQGGTAFIVDESDKVVTFAGVGPVTGANDDVELTYELSAPWALVSIVPTQEILRESATSGYIILFALVTMGAVSVMGAFRFSKSVSSPIREVTTAMQLAQGGDLSARVGFERPDEVGALAGGFNLMIERISGLMDRVAAEQQELAMAEVRNLQAQINPHFLYNTLDSIVWLALSERKDDVVTVTRALTRLFRRSLSGGSDVVPLRSEIEHIESYLTIQAMRYLDRFTYSINVPDDLLEVQVLKLVLQPLVENAIYHGIKPSPQGGHITVTAVATATVLEIAVRDNGVGMAKEELKAVRQMLDTSETGEFAGEHIGVHNVHRRLQLVYGKEYGLRYESSFGTGTVATLRLPIGLEGD